MIKKESQVDWKGQTLPLRVGKPKPGQGVRVPRNKLEASGGNRLEPQGARVAGTDDVPCSNFKQMTVFGSQRGATKLAPFPRLLHDTWNCKAPERCEWSYAAP